MNGQALDFKAMSLAEIMRAASVFVLLGPDETARQHEPRLESLVFDFNLLRYAVAREADADHAWTFVADDPINAEEAPMYHECLHACSMTSALAGHADMLSLAHGWHD